MLLSTIIKIILKNNIKKGSPPKNSKMEANPVRNDDDKLCKYSKE